MTIPGDDGPGLPELDVSQVHWHTALEPSWQLPLTFEMPSHGLLLSSVSAGFPMPVEDIYISMSLLGLKYYPDIKFLLSLKCS